MPKQKPANKGPGTPVKRSLKPKGSPSKAPSITSSSTKRKPVKTSQYHSLPPGELERKQNDLLALLLSMGFNEQYSSRTVKAVESALHLPNYVELALEWMAKHPLHSRKQTPRVRKPVRKRVMKKKPASRPSSAGNGAKSVAKIRKRKAVPKKAKAAVPKPSSNEAPEEDARVVELVSTLSAMGYPEDYCRLAVAAVDVQLPNAAELCFHWMEENPQAMSDPQPEASTAETAPSPEEGNAPSSLDEINVEAAEKKVVEFLQKHEGKGEEGAEGEVSVFDLPPVRMDTDSLRASWMNQIAHIIAGQEEAIANESDPEPEETENDTGAHAPGSDDTDEEGADESDGEPTTVAQNSMKSMSSFELNGSLKEEKADDADSASPEPSQSRRPRAHSVDYSGTLGPTIGINKKPGKSFGVHLNAVAVVSVPRDISSRDRYSRVKHWSVPSVLNQCGTFIRRYGLTTVGIFRISASESRIAKLQKKLEKDGAVLTRPNAIKKFTPIEAADTMKIFARSLPEPLITSAEMKIMVNSINSHPVARQQLGGCNRVLSNMDTRRYDVLTYYLGLLYDVSRLHETNRMTSARLATILSPTIFSASLIPQANSGSDRKPLAPSDVKAMWQHVNEGIAVLQLLIDQYPRLYVPLTTS